VWLAVATAGDDNAAPLLYADKAGLFKKTGLDKTFSAAELISPTALRASK